MGILDNTINNLVSLQDLLNDIIENAKNLDNLDLVMGPAQLMRFKNKIINYVYASRFIVANILSFQEIYIKEGEV